MKIGAARAEYEYDERFVLDGRFFLRWTTYWITWRPPTASERRSKYVKKFGRSSRTSLVI
ncbi:MAG: hypothetical protein RMM98_03865 [Acidobacteriota bacterium]|nr:hypothetical protein [Blastocatellia bacterium]MDW8238728.1 hypothetical protein [Acidobacteriota bacterium]